MTRVEHLMTPAPATIQVDATAAEAARTMLRIGLRHLPVVDADGGLVGMVSDRDLRGPMVGDDRPTKLITTTTAIGELMTRDVITASPGDDLGAVVHKIVAHRIGAVPIVDLSNRLLGILSFVDVLRRLAEDAARDLRAIELMDR
jgi:acetoin utilization protein AcuB